MLIKIRHMGFLKKKRTLFYTLLLSVCFSCVPHRINLSKEEMELQNSLRIKYDCNNIEFRHDYYAITKNRNNGVFFITMCDRLCIKDSNSFKEMAWDIAKEIKPILSHSANYSSIRIAASIDSVNKEYNYSSIVCEKSIIISLKNLKVIKYNQLSK
jgi:hypothetical protein